MARLRSFLWSCVSTPLNALLSLALVAWLAIALPGFVRWAVIDAVWRGGSGQACAGAVGACWPYIGLRASQILFGLYPAGEHWRAVLAGALGLAGVLVLLLPWLRRKLAVAAALLLLYPPVAALLLRGGVLGLASVPTREWGGLLLTLVVAATAIVSAIPLGLLLALGRRSAMPVVAALSAGYIDLVRGLPLVGVLFLAVVLLPLFLPPGLQVDNLVCALVAFGLFNAATLAEVFRGGLQSVPRHQYESATALGLSHGRALVAIVIPQAVTAALPGIVNVCVEIVKETTLILIIGLSDLLGVLQSGVTDPSWLVSDEVRRTAYFFGGLVFWTLCFGLSRYSASIERRLGAGRRG